MQEPFPSLQDSLLCALNVIHKYPEFNIWRIKVELNSYQTDRKSTDMFFCNSRPERNQQLIWK